MPTIHVTDLSDGRLDVYARLTDHQLRNVLEPEQAIMVVESPFALEVDEASVVFHHFPDGVHALVEGVVAHRDGTVNLVLQCPFHGRQR